MNNLKGDNPQLNLDNKESLNLNLKMTKTRKLILRQNPNYLVKNQKNLRIQTKTIKPNCHYSKSRE